ncbi:unnamed protein product [Diplocarpon coronariae]
MTSRESRFASTSPNLLSEALDLGERHISSPASVGTAPIPSTDAHDAFHARQAACSSPSRGLKEGGQQQHLPDTRLIGGVRLAAATCTDVRRRSFPRCRDGIGWQGMRPCGTHAYRMHIHPGRSRLRIAHAELETSGLVLGIKDITAVTGWGLLLLLHLRSASATAGNLTISFAKDSAAACGSGGPPEAMSLTTSSVPRVYTCFNISDVFAAAAAATGFQRSQGTSGSGEQGVGYALGNLASYDGRSNYSQVSIRQTNLTRDQSGQGRASGRRVTVYAFPDCAQVSREGGGDDEPYDAHPWFEQSCQTAAGGDCHTVPYSVRSFSIVEDHSQGRCRDWAFLGAAPASTPLRVTRMGALAALVGLWVTLFGHTGREELGSASTPRQALLKVPEARGELTAQGLQRFRWEEMAADEPRADTHSKTRIPNMLCAFARRNPENLEREEPTPQKPSSRSHLKFSLDSYSPIQKHHPTGLPVAGVPWSGEALLPESSLVWVDEGPEGFGRRPGTNASSNPL